MTMAKSSEIMRAILAAEKVFMAKYNKGDAPGLAALYTRDGQILPPNSDVVKGVRALKALFKGFWKAGETVIKLDTVEVEGSGDMAYEVGKYALLKEGKVDDRGKYIVIWRKVGGRWKLHRDIFNSSMSVP
jgi:ketosteroid isomerase-like protein